MPKEKRFYYYRINWRNRKTKEGQLPNDSRTVGELVDHISKIATDIAQVDNIQIWRDSLISSELCDLSIKIAFGE